MIKEKPEFVDFKTIDLELTGERLRLFRLKADISVKELASRLGISSVMAIYKWEHGMNLPTIENLLNLSDIYGVSMNDLLIATTVKMRKEKVV